MRSFSAYTLDKSQIFTWFEDRTVQYQTVEYTVNPNNPNERIQGRSAPIEVPFEPYDSGKFHSIEGDSSYVSDWMKTVMVNHVV